MPRTPRNLIRRIVIGGVALVGLGYLFAYSLETSVSEPYTVNRSELGPWTLVLDPADGPNSPLLSVHTGSGVVSGLFRQLFQRAMESMNTPIDTAIPVVLHDEFTRGLAAHMTPDQLLMAARAAGLETATHEPQCLAHRRVSEPGLTRQIYFATVDSPAIVTFREGLARTAPGAFDAAAVSPVMIVGASDAGFHRWLPIRATDADCVSPIQTIPSK
jgi:hypothetical protein